VFIIKEQHMNAEVINVKVVPLNAKQARGYLMSVEALCMLLTSANLLQPKSTQRAKY
jgi:hypothetical protein